MIQRYLTLRMRVEKFLKQFVFGTICLLNDIRKPTQAQLSHRIRIVPHRKDSNLWTPNIRWNKENLRDDLQKLRFISDLVGKDLLPPATLYSAMNLNEADIKQKLKEEAQRKKKEGVPSPLPGGMPMPTGGEGEMMPSTELPTAPIAETPRGRPPESVKNTALPVGI